MPTTPTKPIENLTGADAIAFRTAITPHVAQIMQDNLDSTANGKGTDAVRYSADWKLRDRLRGPTRSIVYDFLAVGGDAAKDTAAWAAGVAWAILTGGTLTLERAALGGRPLLINQTAVAQLGATGVLNIQGIGMPTIRLAGGMIVNTPASYKNHMAVLRVEGGDDVWIDGIDWDGNNQNQTYPPALPTLNTYVPPPGSTPTDFATIADGLAGTGPGGYFSSAETGITRYYLRTAVAPFYIEQSVGGVVVVPFDYHNFGRGSSPRRHNAMVEIFSDGVNRPNVLVTNCRGRNAYFNSFATIDCKWVMFDKFDTDSDACNGVAFCACERFEFINSKSRRDGVCAAFPQTQFWGDRAQVQGREWQPQLTSATEDMPVFNEGNSKLSQYVHIDNLSSDQNGVLGQFIRGVVELRVGRLFNRNVGYGRIEGFHTSDGDIYGPWGFWAEVCNVIHIDGDVILQADTIRAGDMKPSVAYVVSFDGRMTDASSPYGKLQGQYRSHIGRIIGYCGQDWVPGGDANAVSSRKNNIQVGAILTSFVTVDTIDIEGWVENGVQFINHPFVGPNRIRNINVDRFFLRNGLGTTAVSLRQIGTPTGDVTGIRFGRVVVRDMRNATVGPDNRQAILLSPSWAATAISAGVNVEMTIDELDIDGLNENDSAFNLNTGVRLNCSNTSVIRINGGQVRNLGNAVRFEALGVLQIDNLTLDTVGRAFYSDQSDAARLIGDNGVITLNGCVGRNVSLAPYTFNFTGARKVAEFTSRCNWQGGGSTQNAALGVTSWNSNFSKFIIQDILNLATRGLPMRTYTTDPTADPHWIGEVVRNTATGVYFQAVAFGGGAQSWNPLPLRRTVNTQDAAYTLVMGDANQVIYHTRATPDTWTIPANTAVAFPIGTEITFVNENGASNVTLAITTDTLRWGALTGSRTLAANSIARALKVSATVWRLSGEGIS